MDYKMKYLKYKKKYLNLKKNLGGNQESNQVSMENKKIILDKFKDYLISYIELQDECKNNKCKSDIEFVKKIELDTDVMEAKEFFEPHTVWKKEKVTFQDQKNFNKMGNFTREAIINSVSEVTGISVTDENNDFDDFVLSGATLNEYIDKLLLYANKKL